MSDCGLACRQIAIPVHCCGAGVGEGVGVGVGVGEGVIDGVGDGLVPAVGLAVASAEPVESSPNDDADGVAAVSARVVSEAASQMMPRPA